MATGDLNIALVLKLVDQVTAPARAVTRTLGRIGEASRAQGRKGVEWANRQLDANRARKSALHGEAFGVLAVGAALGASLKPAIDFEKSMSQVGAISRANDAQLTQLTATARQLGATTPWAASEAADGMRYLSMAGFKVNQTIAAMPGMLNLASAGAIGLGQAADISSNILTGFNMKASQMGHLGDVLTNTFTTSNTDLTMLGDTMKYVAPNATALGISLEQTAAMVGKLGDAGIQGSQAGTSLRAMMSRMAALPPKAMKALAQLHVKTMDAKGDLRDMPTVLAEIDKALHKFGTGDQARFRKDIFGMEAASAATVLLKQAGSGNLQAYAKSLEEAGSAARVAQQMNDNAAGALKHLGSIGESLAISIGTILLPQIVDLINTIIPVIAAFQGWADAHPALISAIFRLTAGLLFFRLGSIALRWTLLSMLTPFLHIIRAGSWMLGLLPRLAGALMALLNPARLVRGALVAIRLAFMTTGIGAILVGVAMAGIWIYNNWSGLRAFFIGFWQTFRAALGPAAPMLDGIIARARDIWAWFSNILGPMATTQRQWTGWGKNAGGALAGIVGKIADWARANSGLVGTIAKVYGGFLALRLIWRLPLAPIVAAGRVMARIGKGPVKLLISGIGLLVKGFIRLGILAMTNPIGLVIAAVAALAYVVYEKWDAIVTWFIHKVDVVKAAFDKGLLNGVFKFLAEFNPFTLAGEGLKNLTAYVMKLIGVPDRIVAAFQAFSLFDTGVKLIQTLWDGMSSLVVKMVDAISAKLTRIVPGWMKRAWNWASGKGADAGEVPPQIVAGQRIAGQRDRGGPVRAGMPYLVGERRTPEIFVPGVAGNILPTRALPTRALPTRALPTRALPTRALPTRALKAAMMATAMTAVAGRLAGPASAMPSGAGIAERVDHRPAMAVPAPAPRIIRHGDTYHITIAPPPGTDEQTIVRLLQAELDRRQDARRADLHDGVDY